MTHFTVSKEEYVGSQWCSEIICGQTLPYWNTLPNKYSQRHKNIDEKEFNNKDAVVMMESTLKPGKKNTLM